MSDINQINNPAHYGGADNPYEAIKVIEACNCGFHIGNALKYIARAGKKGGESTVKDLRKANWYLKRMVEKGIKNGFVRLSNNPYTPAEVAKAWGVSERMTTVLENIWYWNIAFAVTDIEKEIQDVETANTDK